MADQNAPVQQPEKPEAPPKDNSTRKLILIVVAVALTIAVYGVVGVIVKMDDVGLHLTATASRIGQTVGRGLVALMPKLLSLLSAVGMVAMLWVGGHILLAGSDHLGWHSLGGLAWLANAGLSAVIGLVVGVVVLALMRLLSLITRSAS